MTLIRAWNPSDVTCLCGTWSCIRPWLALDLSQVFAGINQRCVEAASLAEHRTKKVRSYCRSSRMCGICGYVGDHQPALLEPMCQAMASRGPDDMGTWSDQSQQVGLGHRRLSIIDLSTAGHQPMSNEDGSIWITYNGEIYNFQEHRRHLVQQGHQFKSHTDTEVLIHLYEEMGLDFLAELNGMFALAIWDENTHQLLIARDHAGVKPVYYWYDGRRLFFASEIKALLCVPGVPRELNASAIPDYLAFLWLPGEETMFRGINKVEPGHYMLWSDGGIQKKPWFSMVYEPDESITEDDWVERVHDGFMAATRRQMVSDVPLGAFLSGGTDSTAIVACMRESFPDRPIKCYTFYCDNADMSRDQMEQDYPYAKRVAKHLDVTLDSFLLKPDCVSLLTKMIYAVEEPDADPTVFPNYLISKRAREDGTTVLLSGMGGDEVFFGYRSYQAMRLYERLDVMPRWFLGPLLGAATSVTSTAMGAQSALPRRLRKLRRAFLGDGLQRHMVFSDWSNPTVRQKLILPEFAQSLQWTDAPENRLQQYYDSFQGVGHLNRRSHVLIKTFLGAHNFIYTDKSSMAVSLEVRVPFMDMELLRLSARIPERYQLKGRTTKSLLKKAMERYIPRDILHRSKTGFGPPLRKWVAEDLQGVTVELLSPSRVRSRGFFDPRVVQHILKQNRSNKADYAYLVYALITLELWMQTFIDQPGVEITLQI